MKQTELWVSIQERCLLQGGYHPQTFLSKLCTKLTMRWKEGKEKRNRRLRVLSADARDSLCYLLKTNLSYLLTLPGTQC